MKNGPCKGCPERRRACWQSCEGYRAWKAEAEKEAAYNRELQRQKNEDFAHGALPALLHKWNLQKNGRR